MAIPVEILEVLEQYRLSPAIFFLKSRAECDAALGMCRPAADLTPEEDFLMQLDQYLDRYPYLRNHRQLGDIAARRAPESMLADLRSLRPDLQRPGFPQHQSRWQRPSLRQLQLASAGFRQRRGG